LAFGLVFYGFGDGRARLVAAGLFGCVTSAICFAAVTRLIPQYYAPKLLIISYAIQLVALLAIALLGLPLGPPHHLFEINVGDAPLRAVLAIVTIPVATVAVALGWTFLRNLSTKPATPQAVDIDVSRRRIYLFVAAALQLLYWPA